MTIRVRRMPAALYRGLLFSALLAAALTVTSRAQTAGPTGMVVSRSVNMVAGDTWPNGDPYLQRQNEPSVAASTRNPQHLLGGANDYRTVDLPGLSTGSETGDAWLGLFKSFDGGERWQSTLLPGYPQDTSAAGMASPLKAFEAGADPVVRPGTNGLLYYAGLAFNRGPNQPSAVFMARFIDNNNKENGDPIKYIGTSIIDTSTGADFIDKPWMAVDVPRAGARSCRIVVSEPPPDIKPGVGWGRFTGWKKHEQDKTKNPKASPKASKDPRLVAETIAAGRIYVAYSRITTVGADVTSRIMFSQSDDCGVTWSKPVQLSNPADKVNQGATVAIDPRSGGVYVAWRQFGLTAADTDAVMVARMPAPGKRFELPGKVHRFLAHRPADRLRRMIAEHREGDPDEVAEIQPFDQGTADDRFRTNAYPTLAIDDDGRVYAAWTERGFGTLRPGATDGDARVVISTSRFGAAWTAPQPVDSGGSGGTDLPGHQLMPSISFAAGKLVVVYYDLREDVSRVFGPFISEKDAVMTVRRRHTIDIRAAHATKGDVPVFGPSIRISQYLMGSRPGSSQVEQLQYNPPDLPLFKLGTVPFMGDYIDLAPAPAFVQNARGAWTFNTAPAAAPVFHVVWTDNRDVRPPKDGDWTHYTPPGSVGGNSTFDPAQQAPACIAGQTGMRNQNVYSARLTWGLIAGSPGNTKPLDPTTPRAFVVFAQNTTTATKTFRFSIASQPVGGVASFTQTAGAGAVYPLMSLDVSVAPRSMVTRTVFVTSSDAKAQVAVDIQEVSAPDMPVLTDGLASRVLLNPDISNPDISNPDISNPDISNPDISNAEVYNPDISNPDISNPDISNPDISNPDISNPDISNVVVANPDISNPDISNPDISNPDISNPDISNPDISNPDISNGALSDVTWTIVNTGNTTASFNVNLFLANAAAKLGGVKTQLIVHKTYSTPVADGCTLKQQTQTVLVANVPNPTFHEPGTATAFDPANPDVTNTTLWLEPGGQGKITLRIIDPDPKDGITINPVTDVTPLVTAQGVDTPNLGSPTPPPSTTPTAAPGVTMGITAQPTNTILTLPSTIPPNVITPVQAHVEVGGVAAAGVQVAVAIAVNPAGGHLGGTTSLLTDASGNATFTDLSIDQVGVGYQLSVSASAVGALPDLTAPFDITYAPAVATPTGGTFVYDGQPHGGTCSVNGFGGAVLSGAISYSSGDAPVNAGTYTVTCAFAGDGYFAPASADATITITPATPVATATGGTFVYDGFAHPGSCVVTGVNATVLAGSLSYSSGTAPVNVGTYTVTCAYPAGGNYTAASDDDTIAITAPPDPYLVTNTNDSGPGSLRQAMLNSNLDVNAKTITFAIPGAGPKTVAPATALPALTQPVVIDGLTQAGAVSGSPLIFIDGAGAAGGGLYIGQAPGIEMYGNNITLRGVGIGRFSGPGVFILGGANNRVEDSLIGVSLPAVAGAVPNSAGIQVNNGSNNVLTRNVVSGNSVDGILFVGGSGTIVSDSRIGTSADGLAAVPNGNDGITLYDGSTNIVVDGNLISGNVQRGIDAQFGATLGRVTGLKIVRNTIGLASDGVTRLPNRAGGVRLDTTEAAAVGAPGQANVISGNGAFDTSTPAPCDITAYGPGIQVLGTSVVGPAIQGNRIGTDVSGEIAVPNVYEGIVLSGWATIGGSGVGEGNVIAGNGCVAAGAGTGIAALDGSGGAIVRGNTIGLSLSGANLLGNGYSGITVSPANSGSVVIGGTAPGEGNVISGNPQAGVAIYSLGVNPHDITIQGNLIGTAADGLTAKPNGGVGVAIGDATHIDVSANTIAFNGSAGVSVTGASSGVSVLANRTFSNGGPGIDLGGNGPTGNDPGDTDAGPNGLQNFPAIAMAGNLLGQAHTLVDFKLDSLPGVYTVQFFSGSSCGAATQVLITTSVGTGRSVLDLGTLVPAGSWITATATDAAGSTSELSACAQVIAPSVAYSAATGHYYQYVNTSTPHWNDASTAANAATFAGLHGHLVSITSAAEQTVVHNLYAQMGLGDMRAWIGLYDATGSFGWSWVNGDAFAYTHWGGGEPNNMGTERWVEFFASGDWNNNTEYYSGNQGYVIEYDLP